MTGFLPRVKQVYEQADLRSGGRLVIIQQSLDRFIEMRAAESAASMAYYALFSLFPLALFFIALMGYVISSEMAYFQAINFIHAIFPFSGDVLDENLKAVVNMRGTFGVISLFAILWSASGYFSTLANAINRAWPMVKLRSYVQSRLVAIAIIGLLILLLALSLISTTLLNVLPYLLFGSNTNSALYQSGAWRAVLRLVAAVFTFLMFLAIYQWVPNKKVRWKAVIVGALFTAISWELAKTLFALYLRSRLSNYAFVYGSLGALIALMVWIYLSNIIALFGAYLVATLDIKADAPAPESSDTGSIPDQVNETSHSVDSLAKPKPVYLQNVKTYKTNHQSPAPTETHLPKKVRG